MTIDEAIKRLDSTKDRLAISLAYDEREAIRLGIEALKRVLEYRDSPMEEDWAKLPGETDS